MDSLKGYKTVILGIVTLITGALTGSGLLTPDLGTNINASVTDAVNAFEILIGAIQAVIGTAIIGFRAITDTSIFNRF